MPRVSPFVRVGSWPGLGYLHHCGHSAEIFVLYSSHGRNSRLSIWSPEFPELIHFLSQFRHSTCLGCTISRPRKFSAALFSRQSRFFTVGVAGAELQQIVGEGAMYFVDGQRKEATTSLCIEIDVCNCFKMIHGLAMYRQIRRIICLCFKSSNSKFEGCTLPEIMNVGNGPSRDNFPPQTGGFPLPCPE